MRELFLGLSLVCMLVMQAESCNKMVCASAVSKCMLIESCKCNPAKYAPGECPCCEPCAQCLGHLYQHCCDCVGMCEVDTSKLDTKLKSDMGLLEHPFDELFNAFTQDPDPMDRWARLTFPIDLELLGNETGNYLESVGYEQDDTDGGKPDDQKRIVNCTVLYMTQCMASRKCKLTCASMGSHSYRYFHDGCCQCVGPSCIPYGIDASKCKECPEVILTDENGVDLTDRRLAEMPESAFHGDPFEGRIIDGEDAKEEEEEVVEEEEDSAGDEDLAEENGDAEAAGEADGIKRADMKNLEHFMASEGYEEDEDDEEEEEEEEKITYWAFDKNEYALF